MPGLDDELKQFFEDDLSEAVGPVLGQVAKLGVKLGTGHGAVWDLVNEDALEWARTYEYGLVKGISNTTVKILQQEVGDWIESGEPLDVLVDRISATTVFGEVRADAIASTEVTRAFAQGHLIAWQQDSTVEGKSWHTAQDEMVCPICGGLSGTSVGIDDLFDTGEGLVDSPPAHVRCRCWVRPVHINGARVNPDHPVLPPAPSTPRIGNGIAPSRDEIFKARTDKRELNPWFYEALDKPNGADMFDPYSEAIAVLADQTGTNEYAVAEYLKEWNTNSNRRPMLNFQRDVAEVFDCELSEWQKLVDQELSTFDSLGYLDQHIGDGYEDLGEFRKALAQSIYADQQALLEESNVDELIVFRGINGEHPAVREWYDAGIEAGAVIDIQDPNVLESWTLDYSTAKNGFASERGAVLVMKVPRERVFSSYPVGMGTGDEHEIVLLNPKDAVDKAVLYSLKATVMKSLGQDMETKADVELAICFADGGEENVDWIKHAGDGGKTANERIDQARDYLSGLVAGEGE